MVLLQLALRRGHLKAVCLPSCKRTLHVRSACRSMPFSPLWCFGTSQTVFDACLFFRFSTSQNNFLVAFDRSLRRYVRELEASHCNSRSRRRGGATQREGWSLLWGKNTSGHLHGVFFSDVDENVRFLVSRIWKCLEKRSVLTKIIVSPQLCDF